MRFTLEIDERESYRTLGQLVKYHRLQNKYSLRDLGELSNISHTLISNIEKGKVISHPDTLKELLSVLKIDFNRNEQLVNEFILLYNEAFNFLFEYEYTKAADVMNVLFERENTYINSIVASDYLILKYFYFALTDQIYGDKQDVIERLRLMFDYVSDRQKQIFSLTYGIYKYNCGLFKEAHDYFKVAKNIGNAQFDMLVDVFIIKTYVKMYRFMDAISLSDKIISDLEKELLYLRAMEVRLSVAYAYIIVLKYADAVDLLEKVYRFATFYNAIYILSECDLLYATIYFKQQKYDLAEIRISKVINRDLFGTYIKMRLAYYRGDNDNVLRYYHEFEEINEIRGNLRSKYLFDVVLENMGIIRCDEKVIVKKLNFLLEFGKKSMDLELIDAAFSLYISYCKQRRMYKKALDLSEEARSLRKYGVNYKK